MTPPRIIVWACDECDYWRKECTSMLHQTENKADPSGPLAVHALHRVEYVLAEPDRDDSDAVPHG